MTTFDGTPITTLGTFSLRVFRDDATDFDAQCDPPFCQLLIPCHLLRGELCNHRHRSNVYVDCMAREFYLKNPTPPGAAHAT